MSTEPVDLSSHHTCTPSPSTTNKLITNHSTCTSTKATAIQSNNVPSPNDDSCDTKHHKLPTPDRKHIAVIARNKLEENVLLSNGYRKQKTIAPSLQGEVFIAVKTCDHADSLLVYGYIRCHIMPRRMYSSVIPEIMKICYHYMQTETCVVIKSANKKLHCQGFSLTGLGQIQEDIVQEASLLKMFSEENAPESMIKYYNFLQDQHHYYLVMEQGGTGLFEFVVECHQLIANGQLSIKEWKRVVRFMFSKMVEVIRWMHNRAHCCNLDISLENIVMGKETRFDAHTGTIKQLEIRFIDFGVSQMFDVTNCDFICDKFVGKSGYKAP
eukprot:50076_1